MTGLTRRTFLQGVGGALGALGLSQLALERQSHRYGRALAQSTRRKVALLIGINAYPARDRLYGPVTDVELQRQLLIHRFGFNPADIHALTDADATRANILGTFEEYILNSVGPEDVVVIHYSGHGARVAEYGLMQQFLDEANRDCIDLETCQNTTLVPVDYGDGSGSAPVEGIMGHTLLLMRSALPTNNVTLVLDCCYSGGGKRGNVIMRSLLTDLEIRDNEAPQITASESDYQQTLLRRLNWGPQDFIDQIQSREGKGFVVASAKAHQQSADYAFDGFNAGAFTYLLTQHLWHETRPLSVAIPIVASSATRLSKHSQIPEYDPQGVSTVETQPTYHQQPTYPAAEAIILEPLPDNQATLWLGGLDPQSLTAFEGNAEFAQIDQSGKGVGSVKLLSRDGLYAVGEFASPSGSGAESGVWLQERIRGIPETITLRVGLDDATLDGNERQIAQELLASLNYIEWAPIAPGGSAFPPQVLIGRFTLEIDQRMQLSGVARRPTLNSIGLFSATQEPLMVESFGVAEETVEAAINRRLKPQLISLLIGRMLALMINQNASQIDVNLMVDHQGSRSGVTTRGGDESAIIVPTLTEQGIDVIPINDQITIRITNNEAIDLHIGLLVIDAAGEVNVLFPPASDNLEADIVRAGRSLALPKLKATEPYGITQVLVMASTQPLQSALRTLRRIAPEVRGGSNEATPDEIMRDMFGALDSRRSGGPDTPLSGDRLIDANTLAVLSLLFDVVPEG